ncbi:MAG: CII family transcriptional regulator [Sulfuriferula sp.]
MPEVLPAPSETARKIESTILRRFASVGQTTVAKAIGGSDTKISRMISDGDIREFSVMLTALGLKTVPTEMKCYNPKDIEYLLYCQQQYARMLSTPDQLEWDADPE